MKVFCLKFHGFGNILHNESQKKDFLQNRLLAKMLKMHLERAAEEHIFIGNPPFANIDCRIFRKVPNCL